VLLVNSNRLFKISPEAVCLDDIVLAEPALIGRKQEFEKLMQSFASVLDGKGTTVFISGEAGSGKTKLVQEFLSFARKKNNLILLSGWCFGEAAVPFFPFIEAFNAYFSTVAQETQLDSTAKFQSQISTWLQGSRQLEFGRSGSLSPEAWKDQAFAAVTNALHSAATEKPLILFLEDLHWADSASLALVYYISRSINSHRILVLSTFRSEELTADEEGHSHPLTETLRLMKRENLVTDIKLTSLNEIEVGKVAEDMLKGVLHPDVISKLANESRGNPLFVVESLRMLTERKELAKKNETWQLQVNDFGVPSKFKDIILRRLGTLKFSQRRILDAASVIGEKFDAELLSTILNQDYLEVLETLNVIAQLTSLVCVEESSFRFNHAKLQETIYEEIPLPLRNGYHIRIAESLENTNAISRLPFSEIAHHYFQAGNTEKAVKSALSAGEDAFARWSNIEAIKHFSFVLQNTPQRSENAEMHATVLEKLGDAYHANSMFKEASMTYEKLADFATGKVRLRAFRKAMDVIYFGMDDPNHLLELLRKATPYASSDRLENARIRFYAVGGTVHHNTDSLDVRVKNYEAVLQYFEEEYSLPDIARSLEALGSFEAIYNRNISHGLSALERAIAVFRDLGDSRALIRATYYATISYNSAGLFEEAIAKSDQTLQLGRKIGDYDKMARACFIRSKMLEAAGHLDEAIAVNREAAEYYSKTDAPLPQIRIYASFVTQYAKAGNMTVAQEYFEKLMNLQKANSNLGGQSIGESPTVNTRDFARAQAIFLAATNHWDEANKYFDKALEIAGKVHTYSPFSQLLVRTDLVWALNKQGRRQEAAVQEQEIQKLYNDLQKKFAHANIDANLMAPRTVTTEQEFEIRLDLVNVSKRTASLIGVKEILPSSLKVNPLIDYSVENGSIDLKKKQINPFNVETITLRITASEPDIIKLSPKIIYIDELGVTQECTTNMVTIRVESAQPKSETLPGRIPTGFENLDALLYGGIPEKHAVALVATSTDQREMLIGRFLETGARSGRTTFYITDDPGPVRTLAEEYPSNFFLLLCNPLADSLIQSKPNIFKLKSIENLTDIDIKLAKTFRSLNLSAAESKIICIKVISDVLLQHHLVNTRRWLSALIPTLKIQGFTILAIIDPQIHPLEELQGVIGVFDGEIRIIEKETSKGNKQVLKIKKLINQKYSDMEIVL
jgi:tetratricopeptide (TPR) repeat protein